MDNWLDPRASPCWLLLHRLAYYGCSVLSGARGKIIDRLQVLCLEKNGLVFRNSVSVSGRLFRCLGYACHHGGFAQLPVVEAVLVGGRARRMFIRVPAECASHGGTCGNLYPGRVDFWLKILEDLWTSLLITRLLSQAMRQCADNGRDNQDHAHQESV